MSVPPEIAWILPIVVPFVIGLLVGFIIKHSIKLILAIVAIVALLVVTGVISLAFGDLYTKAMEFLPRLISTGRGIVDILPYSSLTFIIGLFIGLWKG